MAGSQAPIVFEGVSKKFRRGERHTSLRDLIPSLVRGLVTPRRKVEELGADDFWALRDVSFEVHPGEALGIIGPNGAGKSTTLKVLTKIFKPTVGRCIVRGRVGALIEIAAGFHPDLTGRENVYLQGAIMGMRRHEIARHFDEIVDFAGVADFIDTPVKRYSSGMNARLGFSIAAHLDPDVLIIDEVLSVGDVSFQQKCYARMETFLKRGVALAFVSHNLPAISQLCHRTLLLERGVPKSIGPTHETLAAYSTAAMSAQISGSDSLSLKMHVHDRPTAGPWQIVPGARVALTIEATLLEPVVESWVGFAVWDLIRNVQVYAVAADSLGVPAIVGEAGDIAEFAFEFTANLARGAYVIEINVFDRRTQLAIARLKPAAQFTIDEGITQEGVANLFLSGRAVPARQLSGR